MGRTKYLPEALENGSEKERKHSSKPRRRGAYCRICHRSGGLDRPLRPERHLGLCPDQKGCPDAGRSRVRKSWVRDNG